MANDLTGQDIQNTYQRVLHVGDDGFMYDGTGSLYTPISASHEITTETSSSHALQADNALTSSRGAADFSVESSIEVVGTEGYKFLDDSDTYIYQQAANNITLYAGDNDVLEVNATGVTVTGNFNATIDGGTF